MKTVHGDDQAHLRPPSAAGQRIGIEPRLTDGTSTVRRQRHYSASKSPQYRATIDHFRARWLRLCASRSQHRPVEHFRPEHQRHHAGIFPTRLPELASVRNAGQRYPGDFTAGRCA